MERIGKYNIQLGEKGFLGGGSFASVHKATHVRTGKLVAVKKAHLPSGRRSVDARDAKEFEEKYVFNEVEVLKSIKHRNVVRLFDSEVTKLFLYIFLEFCSGGSLIDFVERMGSLLVKMKVSFMQQMSSGIQCLHLNHLLHRDLKPENILVQVEEAEYVIKITDLGLAKRASHASAVATASYAGTESWMAPEIYPQDGYAKYSSSADIFSLGLIFLSLLEHAAGKSLKALTGMWV